MGYRQRVVVEAVCDMCKKGLNDGQMRVGTLETREPGARGRSERWEVAFHKTCYKKLVASANKPRAAAQDSKSKKPAGATTMSAAASATYAERAAAVRS